MVHPNAEEHRPPSGVSKGLGSRIAKLFSSSAKLAAVPPGTRVYAVGDIHGCSQELDRLTAAIVRDGEDWIGERRLIYMGDYVDRGPDSKGVVDRLLNPPDGFIVQCLRGNHDQTLLDFLGDPAIYMSWRDFGARQTLVSYGVTPPLFDKATALKEARDRFQDALPGAHRDFFESLALSTTIGDYFFAHAGVRPGVALDEQLPEDLLWARDEFLFSSAEFGKVIVHGHTPATVPVRRRNRIGIDTGAYATGKLTAAVLEGTECRFLAS
jgi:serine/threonine protein phosphatase 1